jgi:dTMP kinase
MPGVFVAFEGGEGSGKSTQARLLADALRAIGHEVVLTREPGGSPLGGAIRSLLLDPASAGLSDRAEALLYAADRAEHVASVIEPALSRSAVVVTDRFVDSSLAYQGAGRPLGLDDVERLNDWATGGLRPDLTLILDLDPAEGLRRAGGSPDRLEAEPLAFHERVRAAYAVLAARDGTRYAVIDASRSAEAVAAAVLDAVGTVLPTVLPTGLPTVLPTGLPAGAVPDTRKARR